MFFRIVSVALDKSASPFRRALQYAFYDWRRDIPPRTRIVATVGLLIQAAVVSGLSIAIGHHAIAIPLGVLFLIGLILLNGALTRPLQAQNPESPLGYDLQTFYKRFTPYRKSG
jgi:hypothetical protein